MELAKRPALALAALVVLLLIANFVMQTRTELQLQARIAAIRAAGDPASIADLVPAPIPKDQNAAFLYERNVPRIDAFDKDYAAFYNSPVGTVYEAAENAGDPMTPEQIAAIRAIVAKYGKLDQTLAKVAACPQYASLLNFSLDQPRFLNQMMQRTMSIRSAARFLDWNMKLLIADGHPDQAVEQGISVLRLARLHEAEPAILSYLVSIAMRSIATDTLYDALAAGPISPELHAALDAELTRADNPQQFAQVLKSERAINISGFDALAASHTRCLSHVIGWPVKSQCIGVLDCYDRELARAGHPNTVNAGLSSDLGTMATLVAPALEAAHKAAARDAARLRALRIFNALTQYRDQHGQEATGLDDLALPKEATIDPYSGQPLKLKHTDDDWIIYSVMENGIDDGGDFTEMKDYGLAPPRLRDVNGKQPQGPN